MARLLQHVPPQGATSVVNPTVSVVVPVFNGEATLGDCLRSLRAQSLPATSFEVIVADDGSTDATPQVAERFGIRVLHGNHAGAPAARNAGWQAARGEWIAFTDADCLPSRNWLSSLLEAASRGSNGRPALGAAGRTVGLPSGAPAARYVDITGGLDAERHLAHPRYPFAPTANVMYRRAALAASGGFDVRYAAYDACDLHDRLRKLDGGEFVFEPNAIVLHHHRADWRAYWRQQLNYGRGVAQFMLHRRTDIRWTAVDELRAFASLIVLGVGAALPAQGDAALGRRGTFIKKAAQRLGFARTYWSRAERRRWAAEPSQW